MRKLFLPALMRSFWRNERGNVLMLTGLLLLFLIGIAGAAVDLGRQQLMTVKLQQASDAGALAAAFPPDGATKAQQQAIALRYFNLNFPTSFLGVTRPTPAISIGSDISVTANGDVKTVFVQTVGNASTPSSALSRVSNSITTSNADYDVVMVVDESGSTSVAAPGGGGTRMDVEKNALNNMIDTIFPDEPTPNLNLRFGLVGYTGHISSIGALTSNKLTAKSYITQLQSRCQNFDHWGMEAGGNMILGSWSSYKKPKTPCPPWSGNDQYSAEENVGVPPAATPRDDGKLLSDVKHVVFLTDGYIMVEPNLCGGGTKPCANSYAVFNAQCDKLKSAGAIVHTISFVSQSNEDITALRKCASTDSDGNARYYYAPDAATLQTILTSVGTTIRNTRLID